MFGFINIPEGHFKPNQGKIKTRKMEGDCIRGLNSHYRFVFMTFANVSILFNVSFMSENCYFYVAFSGNPYSNTWGEKGDISPKRVRLVGIFLQLLKKNVYSYQMKSLLPCVHTKCPQYSLLRYFFAYFTLNKFL